MRVQTFLCGIVSRYRNTARGDSMQEFTVPKEIGSISVQQFLRRHCGVSARLLAKLKRVENGIMCKGVKVRSIDILHGGDVVTLRFPQDEGNILPVKLPLHIVYEDDTVLILNKPPFMPVHPVRDHQTDTLANAVMYYAAQKGEKYTFRAVNRLDKDTSGLILAVKNGYSHTFLIQHTQKRYTALCEGELYGSGVIDSPIRRMEGHTIQREVSPDGARAVTHYESIEVCCGHTLLSLWLETGRTHQIRTHLSSIHHPLAGDEMYGGSREIFCRQCLHCEALRFMHPVLLKEMTVRCPAEDWLKMLKDFKGRG